MSSTYAEKLKLAASLRAGTGLADGMAPQNSYDKLKIRREAAHLPSWFRAVLPPPPRRKTGHERKEKRGREQ